MLFLDYLMMTFLQLQFSITSLLLHPCLFLFYLEIEESTTVPQETTTKPNEKTTESDETTTKPDETTTTDTSTATPGKTDGTTTKPDETTTTDTSTAKPGRTDGTNTKPDETSTCVLHMYRCIPNSVLLGEELDHSYRRNIAQCAKWCHQQPGCR